MDKSQPDRVVILFDGLDKLVNGKHYQTTEGQIEVGKPMLRAYIHIAGAPDRSTLLGEASRKQAQAFRDVTSYPQKHDFFLVLKSGVEIHQKGFEPTYHYKNYENDSKGLMSSVPYCSKNNDVWVLRLPVGTPTSTTGQHVLGVSRHQGVDREQRHAEAQLVQELQRRADSPLLVTAEYG